MGDCIKGAISDHEPIIFPGNGLLGPNILEYWAKRQGSNQS